MSYKVICTDIDGTLLDHRRELSELTIKTFKDLPPKTEVILASSRMPSAMTHLQQQLGRLNSPLICYNGGYVIHYKDRNPVPDVLYSTVIPVQVCEGIIALTRNTSIHSSLYFQDTWYAPQIDYWSEREARITKVAPVIAPHSEVIASWKEREIGAHKVMCMGEENEINALEHKLNEMFSGDIHIYRSRPTYLELAPRIISKGSALRLLLEKRLAAELTDVMAFGDNYNDIELLKLAGKGIAVSNARKEVIEIADEVTLDSKADGVAVAIQKYRGDFFSG
jgi:Cof subfamily protein (haloacid dehalogenase superfamily)